MFTCLYKTVLERPCGRPATRPLSWVEIRPAWDSQGQPILHAAMFCPFHYDLTLALLVLDCTVHEITTAKAAA